MRNFEQEKRHGKTVDKKSSGQHHFKALWEKYQKNRDAMIAHGNHVRLRSKLLEYTEELESPEEFDTIVPISLDIELDDLRVGECSVMDVWNIDIKWCRAWTGWIWYFAVDGVVREAGRLTFEYAEKMYYWGSNHWDSYPYYLYFKEMRWLLRPIMQLKSSECCVGCEVALSFDAGDYAIWPDRVRRIQRIFMCSVLRQLRHPPPQEIKNLIISYV